MVAVLSKNKTCPRGEERLLHSEGLCCLVAGQKEMKASTPPSGRECSQGRRLDHGSRRHSRGGSESTRNTTKGNGYCLQTGGGEREEEVWRRRKRVRRKGGGGEGKEEEEGSNPVIGGWLELTRKFLPGIRILIKIVCTSPLPTYRSNLSL